MSLKPEPLPEPEATYWLARARAGASPAILAALDRLVTAQGLPGAGAAVAAVIDAARAAEFTGAEGRDSAAMRRALGAIDNAITGAVRPGVYLPPALWGRLLATQRAIRSHNRLVAARPHLGTVGRPRKERAGLLKMLCAMKLPKRDAERLVSHLLKLQ